MPSKVQSLWFSSFSLLYILTKFDPHSDGHKLLQGPKPTRGESWKRGKALPFFAFCVRTYAESSNSSLRPKLGNLPSYSYLRGKGRGFTPCNIATKRAKSASWKFPLGPLGRAPHRLEAYFGKVRKCLLLKWLVHRERERERELSLTTSFARWINKYTGRPKSLAKLLKLRIISGIFAPREYVWYVPQ